MHDHSHHPHQLRRLQERKQLKLIPKHLFQIQDKFFKLILINKRCKLPDVKLHIPGVRDHNTTVLIIMALMLQVSSRICLTNGSNSCIPNHPTTNHGTNCTAPAIDGTQRINTLSAVCSNASHSCCCSTHVTNLGRRTMSSPSPTCPTNASCRTLWNGRWPHRRHINGSFVCTPFNNIRRNNCPKVKYCFGFYYLELLFYRCLE